MLVSFFFFLFAFYGMFSHTMHVNYDPSNGKELVYNRGQFMIFFVNPANSFVASLA